MSLRLDKWLSNKYPGHSRTYFQFLIEKGAVFVNGHLSKKRILVGDKDHIDVTFSPSPELGVSPEEIPLDILFEDSHLLAINKPAGMVVHPAPGHGSQTFANALVFHCKELETAIGDLRPGIVHRLDKETSGVLLAAKTPSVHAQLINLFSTRQVEKRYLAICVGDPGSQRIEAAIGRDPRNRQRMSVCTERGKPAISICRTLAKKEGLSLVEVQLITGRTHQIRVHMRHVGTPVLGDPVYGSSKVNATYNVHRQLLHARFISLIHPITGLALEIQAPFPEDFSEYHKIFFS